MTMIKEPGHPREGALVDFRLGRVLSAMKRYILDFSKKDDPTFCTARLMIHVRYLTDVFMMNTTHSTCEHALNMIDLQPVFFSLF